MARRSRRTFGWPAQRVTVIRRVERRIELAAGTDDGATTITVTDNGPGIVADAREKIFIPFFSTKPGGTGIGLALSRQIMRLHRGEITVRSEPDRETRFTLRF